MHARHRAKRRVPRLSCAKVIEEHFAQNARWMLRLLSARQYWIFLTFFRPPMPAMPQMSVAPLAMVSCNTFLNSSWEGGGDTCNTSALVSCILPTAAWCLALAARRLQWICHLTACTVPRPHDV